LRLLARFSRNRKLVLNPVDMEIEIPVRLADAVFQNLVHLVVGLEGQHPGVQVGQLARDCLSLADEPRNLLSLINGKI